MTRPHKIIVGATLGGWEVASVDFYGDWRREELIGEVYEQQVTLSLRHVGTLKAEVTELDSPGRDSRAARKRRLG